jgi:hypothetical protein
MDSNLKRHKAVPFLGNFPSLEDFKVDASSIDVPFDSNSASSTTLATKKGSTTHECVQYDDQTKGEFIVKNCTSQTSEISNCFTLWQQPNTNLLMGCWKEPGSDQKCPRCDRNRPNSNLFFCCCTGNRCNVALSFTKIQEYLTQKQRSHIDSSTSNHSISASSLQSIVGSDALMHPTSVISSLTPAHLALSLLPVGFLMLILLFTFRFVKRRKTGLSSRSGDKKGANLDAIESQQPFLAGVQIKQVEKIFTSQSSTVWKGILTGDNVTCGGGDDDECGATPHSLPEIVTSTGCLTVEQMENGTFRSPILPKDDKTPENGRYVAIKVLRVQKTWKNEKEVYMIPQIRHKNILKFITAEDRGDVSEYWLVTEYHQRGSLSDHLEHNTLSFLQMLKISLDIAQGLAHLHSHVDRANQPKPIVAHRDLKSGNILLKSDLSACIADFGMSLILQPNQPTTTSLGQVGTRKYMAPEYLDGAIHFSGDALLRVDIYACAMIFWEMVNRCTVHGQPVEPYRTPFEKELGNNVDLMVLRKFVTEDKKRPQFPPTCARHHGLSQFCRTIEDCWEQDAEARLSASCVEERLLPLM